MTSEPPTTQRIFTPAEHIDPDAPRTLKRVYNDQDIAAFVEWINPGGGIFQPPHSHPESAHIFVVLEGEGQALTGEGKWERIQAGQFVVQPRNKVHAMRNTSPDKRMSWVSIDVNSGPYVMEERTEQDE